MFSLTRGTFGLTLKLKLMQIKFKLKPEENHFDTCLFDSDEENEKPICLNPDLGYDEID